MWALVELGQKRTRSVQPCCGPGFLFLLGVGGGPDSCGDTSSHSRRLLDPWASQRQPIAAALRPLGRLTPANRGGS